jgi:hypothetical protein
MSVADRRAKVWLLILFLACVTLLAAACGGRSGMQGVQLTVTKTGDGEGTVRSDPEGIDCGETCQARFTQDALVTLIPLAASNSEFVGWEGCDVEGTTCTVTMDEAKTVTAEFKRREVVGGPFNLRILRQGSGQGIVTSIPEGISCAEPGDPGCDASFDGGTEVTLQAQPGEGFVFGGWSGAGCSAFGTQDCTVFMDEDKQVTAIFNVEQNVLNVIVQPSSTGRVFNVNDLGSANPPVDCTTDCDYGYSTDLIIGLRAQPLDNSQYQFLNWGGACAGTTSQTCNVTVDGDKSVTANFRLVPPSIDSFSANPSNLTEGEGQSATLSWQVTGGGSIALEIANNRDDTVLDVTGQTSVTVTPSQTTTYTLTARNSSGEDTATRTVVVGGAPNISSFSASPAAVRPGDKTELSWEIGGDGEITVTITDQEGQVVHQGTGSTGSVEVNPTITTTYTLRAESTFGSDTDTTSVTMLYRLTLEKSGSGRGTVTSDPEGISCGNTCTSDSADFLDGTEVTLTAAPSGISRFEGWQGACSGSQGTCTVTMDGDKEVTAVFRWLVLSVVIEPRPSGGYVTSNPTGIDCGDGNRETCTRNFEGVEQVVLTAHESTNFDFDAWQDCPASSGTSCTLQMKEEEKKVGAFFERIQHLVSVLKNGQGTVTSTPSGINCGSTCGAQFNQGDPVALNTTDAPNWQFDNWSGDCTGTTCSFSSLDGPKNVTANFSRIQHRLTVRKHMSGTGSGTVTSSPSGINCGPQCPEFFHDFNQPGPVVLTATANDDSEFKGWSGDACSGSTERECSVELMQAVTVTARFNLKTYTISIAPRPENGRITSSNPNLDCGSVTDTCTGTVAHGRGMILTAVPDDGYEPGVWGGDCSGSAQESCTLSNVTSNKTVTASFVPTPAVNSVTINEGNQTIEVGQTFTFTATVDAVGGADESVSWQSDAEDIATVDDTGMVTGVAEGDASITAISDFDANKSDTVTVTVVPVPEVISVAINEGDQTITVGETVQLSVTVEAVGGADGAVTWSSSDEAVATVNENGVVTGVAEGTAEITATSVFDATKSDSVTVMVNSAGDENEGENDNGGA